MEPTLEKLNAAILLADQEGDTAAVEELVRAAQALEATQQASQGYQPTDYDMGQATVEAGEGIVEGIKQFPQRAMERTAETFARGGTTGQLVPQVVGEAVKSYITNPIAEAVMLGGKGLLELIPDSNEKAIADKVVETLAPLADTPLAEVGLDAARFGINAWTEFAQNNPVQADTLKGVFQIAEVYKPPMMRNPVPYSPSALRSRGVALQRSAANTIEERTRADLEEVITPLDTPANRTERQEQMYTDEGGTTRYRRTQRDEDTINTLKKTKVSGKNSNQKNQDIIIKEINNRGEKLTKELREYDYVRINKAGIRSDMQGIIDDLLDPVTGNPALAGETQAKTAAQLFRWLDGQLGDGDITPARLHELRKTFDNHIANTGRKAFEGNESAFAISQKAVRDYLNDKIIEVTPLSKVAEQLKDMHLLYRTKDVVKAKAAKDADTALGRSLQNIMRATDSSLPKTPYGKIATLGVLGSFTVSQTLQDLLPYVGTVAVAGGLYYAAYRGTVSPALRKYLGKTMVTMDKISRRTKSKEMREALALDRATLVEIMKLPLTDAEDLTKEEQAYEYPEIPYKQ